MKDKHQKHPPLKKPTRGRYHKNEWAIYGTSCDNIESLFSSISTILQNTYRISFIDADHNINRPETNLQIGKKKYYLPDPIHWNEYDDKLQPWSTDAVIVNGNHYPADKQIVVLNPVKKDSLFRRLDQLTNIDIIIATRECDVIYDFLKPYVSAQTKIIDYREIDQIVSHLSTSIEAQKPILKAVILAGGESKRMGLDKSQIVYHKGKNQQIYIADLCKSLGLETYISKSIREEQQTIEDFKIIQDRLINMGPYGGIISAMMSDPDAAWLVLACDLPYMNKKTINTLIKHRSSSHDATAYQIDNQEFPEPLIAIYEPAIYQRMLRFLSLGYACPRKVLINSNTHVIPIGDTAIAYNANTPEEMNTALKTIRDIG